MYGMIPRKAAVANDRFYTPDDTVDQIIGMVDMANYSVIIEPSAGDGAILKKLPPYAVGYDLEPHDDSIFKMNWLEPKDINGTYDSSMYIPDKANRWGVGRALVIGNPPFGRQGSLASKFFNEAATFADSIVFIMPRSYMKNTMLNRLNHYYHIDDIVPVVDDHYILPSGGFRVVPTVIVVAHREDTKREDYITIKKKDDMHLPFAFTSYPDADYMIIRVGGRCGALVSLNEANSKNKKYNYFIRVTDETCDMHRLFESAQCRFHDFRDMTTGPRSLSKGEITQVIIDILKNHYCC